MPTLICDASVVLKWFKFENETDVDRARTILEANEQGKIQLVEPDLVYLEIANVLTLTKTWPIEAVWKSLKSVQGLQWRIQKTGGKLLDTAVKVARDNQIAIYDAVYLALAEMENGTLVTADTKHHGQINSPRIVMLANYLP